LLTPTTPIQLVLTKYVSAFSMALFMVNIPGLVLRDLQFLFYLNAAVLLMTALCMAAAVISPERWAPLIPLFIVFVLMNYLRPQLKEQFDWIAAHPTAASIIALSAIPVIVYCSVIVFKNEVAKGALNEQREYLD
jgi:hypothetical protein